MSKPHLTDPQEQALSKTGIAWKGRDVLRSSVQCWEKATNYLSVEERFIHLTDEHFVATPEGVAKLIDENTIGIFSLVPFCRLAGPTLFFRLVIKANTFYT